MGCFLFSGAFWGILLILLGALIIIKVLFNINIPVFRIGFALLLIYFGIRMLAGGFDRRQAVFGEEVCRAEESGRYSVLFGKGEVDLSGVSVSSGTVRKEISTVFGISLVKINADIPVKIIVNAAFDGARMPDGNAVSFGTYTYTSGNYRESDNGLIVQANVVFGGLDVIKGKRGGLLIFDEKDDSAVLGPRVGDVVRGDRFVFAVSYRRKSFRGEIGKIHHIFHYVGSA
jgi:hypothetical protein